MKKDQKHNSILGIDVSSRGVDGLLKVVRERLTITRSMFVVTPNSENILGSYKKPFLQKILNKSDLAPVDSIGVSAASYYLSLKVPETFLARIFISLVQGLYIGLMIILRPNRLTDRLPVVKGRELFVHFLNLANEKKWRVYLLGGESNEAELTAEYINKTFPHVRIRYQSGPMLDTDARPRLLADKSIQEDVLSEIRQFKPHMLFVAFNFPKQEIWLAKYLAKLPVGLGMTVGGTFNFISGRSKLPPKMITHDSFEWLWRLLTEPWRIKRVFRAAVIFPYTVFIYKLKNNGTRI